MSYAFLWWLAVELLGFIGLPIAFVLFKRLPDRGYAFGKALSILLLSFLLWLSASVHILPNARWAIVLIAALLAWVSIVVFIRRRREIVAALREKLGVIVATEVIFLLAFTLWVVVRAYNPEILFTEKPMDFAFVNGIMRSDYFPPVDPWLSGVTLNNYYFGHMIMATLTKLTGVPAATAFNLSLALIFGLAAIGAFSIVYNLVRMIRGGEVTAMVFGTVAAVFLLILGNLEGVLEMLYAHGYGSQGFWAWIGIEGLDAPYSSEQWYPTQFWWWWHATRMIQATVGGVGVDYTIAEFPIFTFILGDLHAHLLSMPFVLLTVAVCLNIVATKVSLGLAWLRRNIAPFVLMIVCLGALGPIHTWDLPVYLFLFAGAIMVQTRLRGGGTGWWKRWLPLVAIAVVGVFVPYLPFYLNMDVPTSGVLPWDGPNSRWLHLLLMWGLFLFVAASFVLFQMRGAVRSVSRRTVVWVCLPVLLLWVVWAVAVAATGGGASVWAKLGHLLPLLILLALTLLLVVRRATATPVEERSVLFALLLFLTAVLLVVGCELFYLRDVFGNRMNTVFRFYFQAWILFAVASPFAVYYMQRKWRVSGVGARLGKLGWWVVLLVLVASSLAYSVAGIPSKTNGFSGEPTLDGLAWHQRDRPEEYEAVSWFNSEVDGAAVIVTAPGYAYTDHGIISECTGLPTVLGWEGHEWVWRASDVAYRGRRADIELVYTCSDSEQILALLDKYDVTYVYVGRLEREMYGEDAGEQLGSLMDVVFQNEGVTVYRVSD